MPGNLPEPLPDPMLLSKQKRKFFAKLLDKKYRDQEKLFLAEGDRTVKELLRALPDEDHLIALIVREPFEHFTDELKSYSGQLLVAQPEDFKSLSDTEHSQGIIGVFQQPEVHFSGLLKTLQNKKRSLVLVLDGLQDPGNAGTIIRTAAWFGIDLLIGSPDTVDYYNPKVVRSTAGSIYSLPLVKSTSLAETLSELKKAGYTIYATSPDGTDARQIMHADKTVIIVGSEARGISEEVFSMADERIKIAGRPEAVESLNAAVSAGILMAFFS